MTFCGRHRGIDNHEGSGRLRRAPTLRSSPPPEKQGADLIVMGTHGLTGVEHLLFGSTAERVVRHAPCPVMTVRAEDK